MSDRTHDVLLSGPHSVLLMLLLVALALLGVARMIDPGDEDDDLDQYADTPIYQQLRREAHR